MLMVVVKVFWTDEKTVRRWAVQKDIRRAGEKADSTADGMEKTMADCLDFQRVVYWAGW